MKVLQPTSFSNMETGLISMADLPQLHDIGWLMVVVNCLLSSFVRPLWPFKKEYFNFEVILIENNV